MKNDSPLRLALGFCALILANTVQANVILNLNLEEQPLLFDGYPVGVVSVTISGLGDHTSPSLSSFILKVNYDPSILAFKGWGVPNNYSGGPFGSSEVQRGLFDVFGATDLRGAELNAIQPSSLRLVLLFGGIANGVSIVSLAPGTTLLDENEHVLDFTSTSAQIDVRGVVPDGGTTAGLLAVSLGTLVSLRITKGCVFRGKTRDAFAT